jgi:predicted aminopeptidase
VFAAELHTIATVINDGCVFHEAGVGAVEISTMRRWLSRFCSPERISAYDGPNSRCAHASAARDNSWIRGGKRIVRFHVVRVTVCVM